MNKQQKDEIRVAHDGLNRIEESHGYDSVEFKQFLNKHHWNLSFDLAGNYIGLVADENGWTP